MYFRDISSLPPSRVKKWGQSKRKKSNKCRGKVILFSKNNDIKNYDNHLNYDKKNTHASKCDRYGNHNRSRESSKNDGILVIIGITIIIMIRKR